MRNEKEVNTLSKIITILLSLPILFISLLLAIIYGIAGGIVLFILTVKEIIKVYFKVLKWGFGGMKGDPPKANYPRICQMSKIKLKPIPVFITYPWANH